MPPEPTDARAFAAGQVAAVRDRPAARLALLGSLYEALPGHPELHLPYRRAALAFMSWQVRRAVLNPLDGPAPGSRWWRAVNERLLRDTAEARGHLLGVGGPTSSPSVELAVDFARHPSALAWYRAPQRDDRVGLPGQSRRGPTRVPRRALLYQSGPGSSAVRARGWWPPLGWR